MKDVEAPASWSDNAIGIAARTYFSNGETSIFAMVHRVVNAIIAKGEELNYFISKEECEQYRDKLTNVLLNQQAAFNTPVWINLGVPNRDQQCWACAILNVEDDMLSIKEGWAIEAKIFEGGSGSGVNISKIRANGEPIKGGGWGSGPISLWMRPTDSIANVVKSGGKCLAPSQRILTDSGVKRVEELAASDEEFTILSYDPPAGKFLPKKATAWLNGQKQLVVIKTSGGTYEVSEDHPIRMYDHSTVLAKDLVIGSVIFSAYVPTKDSFNKVSVTGQKVISVTNSEFSDVYSVEVQCPTEDDKSSTSGHTFVLWPNETKHAVGTGITVFNSRRAAKMVVMDVDHPEIEEFVSLKVTAERMSRVLQSNGFDISMQGIHSANIPFQQANNSVRVSDAFMRAVERDEQWPLTFRVSGEVSKTISAKKLWLDIAEAAWDCGDPGIQFDDTINNAHTCMNDGRQRSSNPCVTGDTEVLLGDRTTAKIKDLVGLTPEIIGGDGEVHTATRVWKTGTKPVYKLTLANGYSLTLTEDHKVTTINRGDVSAKELTTEDTVKVVNVAQFSACGCGGEVVSLEYVGEEDVFDLTEPATNHFVANGLIVHNCSEYLFLDDTFCNLASINLIKFLNNDLTIDVDSLAEVTKVMIFAQDILCDVSSYPSDYYRQNALQYRTLGLGFTNLGGLLMSSGLAYDSEEGRNKAAFLMSIIQGNATLQSQELAERLGAFPAYERNSEHQIRVIQDQKRAALSKASLWSAQSKVAEKLWSEVDPTKPIRNAQLSVQAPTGTISFLMDAETTGIEPVIAFSATKTLSGSGTVSLEVSDCIRRGIEVLRKDGQSDEDVVEANKLVFQTALGENAVSPEGHVLMMAAVQPFTSGGISKTVNCPNDWTPEDIADIYMLAWKKGVKCIAVYRDGSKAFQPVEVTKKVVESAGEVKEIVSPKELRGSRKKPQGIRPGVTHKFTLGGEDFYITINFYPDGEPCELFIKGSKHGSALSGWMDQFSIAVSLGLQYGVPVDVFLDKMAGTNYAPQGLVLAESEIKFADSPADYVARFIQKLLASYADDKFSNNVTAPEFAVADSIRDILTDEQPIVKYDLEKTCGVCGAVGTIVSTGTCHTCSRCGESDGCR